MEEKEFTTEEKFFSEEERKETGKKKKTYFGDVVDVEEEEVSDLFETSLVLDEHNDTTKYYTACTNSPANLTFTVASSASLRNKSKVFENLAVETEKDWESQPEQGNEVKTENSITFQSAPETAARRPSGLYRSSLKSVNENTILVLDESTTSPEKEIKILQQTVSREWELKSFKARLNDYLDNEYKNGEEICATRSSLITNGQDVGLESTFLAHLYLSRIDENRNSLEKTPKNAAADGASGGADEERIYVEVTMRLVEAADQTVLSNFIVFLSSESCENICQLYNPIFPRNLGSISSAAAWLSCSRIKTMDESLFITIRQSVYAEPFQWGLDCSEHVEMMNDFLSNGKIDWEKEEDYLKIVHFCRERNLVGVIEEFKQVSYCEPC